MHVLNSRRTTKCWLWIPNVTSIGKIHSWLNKLSSPYMTGRTLVCWGIIWKDYRNISVLQLHDAQLLLGWRLYPLIFLSSTNTGVLLHFSIRWKKTSYLCRFVLMLCAVLLRYSADVVPVITKRSMVTSVATNYNWKGISNKYALGKCRLHSVVCGEYFFSHFTINLFGNCRAFGFEYLTLKCYLLCGCCCGYIVIWHFFSHISRVLIHVLYLEKLSYLICVF